MSALWAGGLTAATQPSRPVFSWGHLQEKWAFSSESMSWNSLIKGTGHLRVPRFSMSPQTLSHSNMRFLQNRVYKKVWCFTHERVWMSVLPVASSGCNAYLHEEENKEEERNKCLLGVTSGLGDGTFCRVGDTWWNGFKMIECVPVFQWVFN